MRAPVTRYPPLPAFVRCPGGDVTVSLVGAAEIQQYADPGEILHGAFVQSDRRILIRDDLKPEQRHRVLWHELAHVAFEDSGITNGMPRTLEEAICDAFTSLAMRSWAYRGVGGRIGRRRRA